MPHKCTACGRLFPDGSTEMLSGCPDCGGNKFQFAPDADSAPPPGPDPGPGPDESAPDRTDPDPGPDRTDPGGEAEDHAQASARTDVVSEEELSVSGNGTAATPSTSPDADAPHESDPDPDPDPDPAAGRPDDRGSAPSTASGSDPDDPTADPGDDRPDLTELREELNEQFESIRILSPGQYELNLMELYDRRECVVSLREDGRYVIEMPDAWGASGSGPDADAGPDA